MTSLMHFLGNRPKKIIKPKINKKLVALSQGKIGLLLKKKQLNKQETQNTQNNNTIYNYNCNNKDNILKNNPYLKNFLSDTNDNNNNNNDKINYNNFL